MVVLDIGGREIERMKVYLILTELYYKLQSIDVFIRPRVLIFIYTNYIPS